MDGRRIDWAATGRQWVNCVLVYKSGEEDEEVCARERRGGEKRRQEHKIHCVMSRQPTLEDDGGIKGRKIFI